MVIHRGGGLQVAAGHISHLALFNAGVFRNQRRGGAGMLRSPVDRSIVRLGDEGLLRADLQGPLVVLIEACADSVADQAADRRAGENRHCFAGSFADEGTCDPAEHRTSPGADCFFLPHAVISSATRQ